MLRLGVLGGASSIRVIACFAPESVCEIRMAPSFSNSIFISPASRLSSIKKSSALPLPRQRQVTHSVVVIYSKLMITEPFYDPTKSYYDNYEHGPFGAFKDGGVQVEKGVAAYEFFGKKIHTPFGIPAGPLLNRNYVIAALDKGYDMPIYKTVRSGVHGCHPYPNVVPVDVEGDLTLELANAGLVTKDSYTAPLSITNSFGVPSYAPQVWQEDVAKAVSHAKEGQAVGVSFQGTKWENTNASNYIEDWVTTAKLVAETKPDFMEANLSCPNEGTTALLCFDVARVATIARRIKDAVGDIPLILKISYFTDQSLLEKLVTDVGDVIDGFATINTISAEVRTPQGEQALPGEGRLRSGVCGTTIKWAGLDMVRRFVALRELQQKKFLVIGVGGVMNVADYREYIDAKADVVMSATGAMWNPSLAKEIKEAS